MGIKQYPLTLERSPVDERDWRAEAIFEKVAIPDILDYRKELQRIRDQGPYGTCAAQSGACMKEWQEWKDYKFDEYMSPQFIYNSRENQKSSGMYSRDLMKILQKIGSVKEEAYPYGTVEKPSKDLLEDAKKHVIKSYASVTTVDALKQALVKNGVCYIAVPVYTYDMQMWVPDEPEARPMGGHAMAIVGYNDNKKHFIIRNSWGISWGDNGYTYFPYSHWGMHWEVWTTIDDESGDPDKWYWLKKIWYDIKSFIRRAFSFPGIMITIPVMLILMLIIIHLIRGGGTQ